MNRRASSDAVRSLAGLGFVDLEALSAALGLAADPDLASGALHRLLRARGGVEGELVAALEGSPQLLRRLLAVLGGSVALGEHLVVQAGRGISDWHVLNLDSAPVGLAAEPDPTRFRDAYRRWLLFVAGLDLTGEQSVEWVFGQLTDLADATLATVLRAVDGQADAPLAVFALGKCGARELNYVSDVDVLFVAPDPGAVATARAQELIRICRQVAWQVDAGLRPEGRSGPLVRTMDSYEAYYRRWAENWEFQALLKARFVAANPPSLDAAAEWAERIAPRVWSAAGRSGFVDQAQAMRQRVERHVGGDARELKLGPGGLRDIEFAVQLLQLVHGRSDVTLRSASTLPALEALTAGGYVARSDGAALADSYRFLRVVEHRLQLRALRRTHRLPSDATQLRTLARSLGYHQRGSGGVVEQFMSDWRRHAAEVRRLHEKLFYRPLLAATARVPDDELSLDATAATERLVALGFADPVSALRHVVALSAGVSRRAAIHRTLLPVILKEFADSADPDRGLLSYRRVSEQLGRSPWFLRLMRDGDGLAPRLARVLGSSRYVADLLERDAEGLALLASDQDLTPRGRPELASLFRAAVDRTLSGTEAPGEASPTARERVLHGIRRHELLRVAGADVCGLADLQQVGVALTDLADAVIGAALGAAIADVSARAGAELTVQLAVIALGRLGGRETGYGSDADVVLVHEPTDGVDTAAAVAAQAVAERLMAILAASAPDPPLKLDFGLRPEGRGGPLIPSLNAYQRYYHDRAGLWEIQALLRARWVAGDPDLGQRFMDLVDGLRYPQDGLTAEQTREIRRMKARIETERLPRSADPATHLKLGRGGLVDVEWAAQLLQLRYAARHPGLRTTGTIDALHAAKAAGVLAASDCDALAASWSLATLVRNAIMLVRGAASDQLPRPGRDLTGVIRLVGRSWESPEAVGEGAPRVSVNAGNIVAGEFVDDYLRVMRKSRRAAERVFSA